MFFFSFYLFLPLFSMVNDSDHGSNLQRILNNFNLNFGELLDIRETGISSNHIPYQSYFTCWISVCFQNAINCNKSSSLRTIMLCNKTFYPPLTLFYNLTIFSPLNKLKFVKFSFKVPHRSIFNIRTPKPV